MNYFGAKCYFSFRARHNDLGEIGYEQRIVLLKAENEDAAIVAAESEAVEYAKAHGATYLEFVEVFKMFDSEIKFSGVIEVYSITMYDDPDEESFLDNYYLTGGNSRT